MSEWIPIKYRPMTEEEKKYYEEYTDVEEMFDCPMPEDGQEILISTKFGVYADICDIDEKYGYGLENHEDWEGVLAWMPLPEPYVPEINDGNMAESEVNECFYKTEGEEIQPKQTDDSCLDFDFDKVKEILKKDGLDNLIVDHTCEEKQEQTRDEKIIDAIDFAIKATDSQDDYSIGMRNGMRYVKSLIDGKEPQYELRRTDEEIKLGIELGDEVVGDYGAKGVVIGIDTYKDEVLLSLLMRNHKVPQLVKASGYKTKTGRHFPQIRKVLEQMKEEADGK